MSDSLLAAVDAAVNGDDRSADKTSETNVETKKDAPSDKDGGSTVAASAGKIGLSGQTVLNMVALAFPAQGQMFCDLAALAGEGNEAKFQSALIAARDGGKGNQINTAKTDTAVEPADSAAAPKIDHQAIHDKYNIKPAGR